MLVTSSRDIHPRSTIAQASAPEATAAHSAAAPADHGEKAVRLRIDAIKHALFVRSSGLSEAHVRVLAEVLDALPPILVHYPTMRLIDGAHRLAAAERTGRTDIVAQYFPGTLDDAFRIAIESNVSHGLPLSLTDRKAAASRILELQPHLSDRLIARSAGLSPRTVAVLRPEVGLPANGESGAARLGSDGKQRPLDATEGRLAGARIVAERPQSTVREIAQQAGISVGTARDVKARVLAGQDPLPAGGAGRPDPTGRPADAQQLAVALGRLRRDPTLRYSDSGRRYLQWLDRHLITAEQCHGLMSDIPPHCHELMAQIARECARAWAHFADELDPRRARARN